MSSSPEPIVIKATLHDDDGIIRCIVHGLRARREINKNCRHPEDRQ